jgi:hypothetical protein
MKKISDHRYAALTGMEANGAPLTLQHLAVALAELDSASGQLANLRDCFDLIEDRCADPEAVSAESVNRQIGDLAGHLWRLCESVQEIAAVVRQLALDTTTQDRAPYHHFSLEPDGSRPEWTRRLEAVAARNARLAAVNDLNQ